MPTVTFERAHLGYKAGDTAEVSEARANYLSRVGVIKSEDVRGERYVETPVAQKPKAKKKAKPETENEVPTVETTETPAVS